MRFLFFLLVVSFTANAQYQTIAGKYDYINNINVGKALTVPKGLGSTNSPAKYDTGQVRYSIDDSTLHIHTGSQWLSLAKTADLFIPSWEQTLLVDPNLTQSWDINVGFNDMTWSDADIYSIYSNKIFFSVADSGMLQGKWRLDSAMNYKANINGGLQDLSLIPKKYADSLKTLSDNYADAKVEDQIIDGVTDKAPSQNAVYDALALKEDVINKENLVIDNSTTKYPTVNLLKTGLDEKLNIVDLPVYTASNGLNKSGYDFRLGGALTQNTNISATDYELNIVDTSEFGTHRFSMQTNGNALIIGKNINGTDSTMLRMSTEDNETMAIAYYNGTVKRVFANSAEAAMEALGADSKGVGFHFEPTIAQFVDTRNTKTGLEYGADYSASYTNRSLVDKEFVDDGLALKVNISDTAAMLLPYLLKSDTAAMLSPYLLKNAPIVAATKTKITYDANGLITAGADATTDDIIEGINLYFTDERAQDAIGSMVDPTLIYNDGLPSLGRAAIDGDIAISAGSNTAAISAGVIVDADINAGAAINATKIADGSVDNTEFQYLDGLTSNVQTQIDNKVTKGGDLDGATLIIGTNDYEDVVITTDGIPKYYFNTNGQIGVRKNDPKATLHLYGTGSNGSNSSIFFGDSFSNTTTPYISIGENGGTDSDAMEVYGKNGMYFRSGAYGGTARMTIQYDGDIVYGGETQVAGAEHTFVGDADVSGDLNVQGNLTAGNILRATATLNFPSTNAGSVSTLTVSVPGADVGDPVFIGMSTGAITTTAMYMAYVSSLGVVTVRFSPKATENPASAQFNIVVFD